MRLSPLARRLLLGGALLCFGCSGEGRGGPPGRGRGGPVEVSVLSTDGDTLTVKHAGGETRIPRHPKRVAAIGDSDSLFFLGLKPIADAGMWDFSANHYLEKYREGVGHIGGAYGARMPNAESALQYHPDLILLQVFDMASVEKMSQVAPTIVMPGFQSDPRLALLAAGRVLDQEDRALRAIAWFDRKVELARPLLKAVVGERPVVVFWLAVKQIRIEPVQFLYQDLGLAAPPQLTTNLAKRFGPSGRAVLELEELGDLDAGAIFVIDSLRESDDPRGGERNLSMSDVTRLPMWQKVPAVQAGRVYPITTPHWVSGGLLGRSVVINEMVKAMVAPEAVPPELAEMLEKERPDDADLARFAPVDAAALLKRHGPGPGGRGAGGPGGRSGGRGGPSARGAGAGAPHPRGPGAGARGPSSTPAREPAP